MNRHLLLLALSAILIFGSNPEHLFADPDGGAGSVQYTLPASRTSTGVAESFTVRKAAGTWQEVCDTCDPQNFTASPFTFLLNDGSDSFKIKGTSDGTRAQVLDKKTAGANYELTEKFDPPYPGSSGARNVALDVGNAGSIGASDSLTAAQTRARAFAVQDIITMAADALATLGGGTVPKGSDQPKQVLFFPKTGGGTTSFSPPTKQIGVLPHDGLDVDILLHEYGHAIGNAFNFDDPDVGGNHSPGKKSGSEKIGWGEGLANEFSIFLQDISPSKTTYSKMKFFGDTFYTDTEDLDIHMDLEGNKLGTLAGAKKVNSKGFDDELSVGRMLWDLYDDTPNEIVDDNFKGTEGYKDTVAFGAQKMWKLMTTKVPGQTHAPYTMKEFQGNVSADISSDPTLSFWGKLSNMLNIGVLNSDHGLAPIPKGAVPKGGGPKPKLTLDWGLADEIAPDLGIDFGQDKDGTPSIDGYDNFHWFRLVFTDPLLQQVAGVTDWLSAADVAVPGYTNEWEYALSDTMYDQLYAGDPFRELHWFVQSESSQYFSPGLLPTDLFGAPIWSADGVVTIPEPATIALLAIALLSIIGSRRRR